MKTWIAILLTVGLIVVCGLIVGFTGINLYVPMIVGTSVWAGIDSSRLHLSKYQSGISYSPIVLGILCSMFWIVGFPWYLSMRHKIIKGTARLRPEYEPWDMASGQMSSKGLVQPWQGRKL
ncbi:MAG: hypothetical protein WDN00_02265 [Limisphaerales bacterium]